MRRQLARKRNPVSSTDWIIGLAIGGVAVAYLWSRYNDGAGGPGTKAKENNFLDPWQPAPEMPEVPGSTDKDLVTPINLPLDENSKFNLAILNSAKKDIGVAETSKDSGPEIDKMLAAVGSLPGNAWCSAAVSSWIRKAAKKLEARNPIKPDFPGTAAGSANPNNLVEQFRNPIDTTYGWIPGEEIEANPSLLKPGMIIFFRKRLQNVNANHVAVFEQPLNDKSFIVVEGNAGVKEDRVDRGLRKFLANTILGAGYFGEQPTVV